MASPHVIEFTDANFAGEVLQSGVPVLVDFWAEWCFPCKQLGPTIDALAADFAGRAKVGKLDTDNNREVAARYGILAIPTVLLFKGGEVKGKFVGLQSKEALSQALQNSLTG